MGYDCIMAVGEDPLYLSSPESGWGEILFLIGHCKQVREAEFSSHKGYIAILSVRSSVSLDSILQCVSCYSAIIRVT